MDQLFDTLQHLFANFVAALPFAAAVIVGAYVLNLVVRRGFKLLAGKASLGEGEIAPFIKFAKWFIVAGTLVLLLSVFGVDIGGMWTMITGIGAMIAVGFVAVWSVLSNCLCTFAILITRPFSIGDHVEFVAEPVRGRVVDLNFMYTTLEGEDGYTIQVPNNLFFQKAVKRRRGSSTVSLAEQLQRRDPAQA